MDTIDRPTLPEELPRENARLRGDLRTVARRISHDLRTPLGGILVAGEALEQILAETDPSALPLVTSLLSSAEELSQIIKRVSFVLRATADPIPPQPILMGPLVTAACQRLESRLSKTGAVLAPPADWPEVSGVADWLEVIWWNLLTNALQHAGPSPRVELGWGRENGHYRFWVTDRGPGVALEKRRQLFPSFDRLHELDAGRGMGLAIVRRLVELQSGACHYEPNPPGGAIFSFTIPAAPG